MKDLWRCRKKLSEIPQSKWALFYYRLWAFTHIVAQTYSIRDHGQKYGVAEVSEGGREEKHGNYAQQWLQDAHHWIGCVAHGRKRNQRPNSQFYQNWLSPF